MEGHEWKRRGWWSAGHAEMLRVQGLLFSWQTSAKAMLMRMLKDDASTTFEEMFLPVERGIVARNEWGTALNVRDRLPEPTKQICQHACDSRDCFGGLLSADGQTIFGWDGRKREGRGGGMRVGERQD